jgi:hypothetical protein
MTQFTDYDRFLLHEFASRQRRPRRALWRELLTWAAVLLVGVALGVAIGLWGGA